MVSYRLAGPRTPTHFLRTRDCRCSRTERERGGTRPLARAPGNYRAHRDHARGDGPPPARPRTGRVDRPDETDPPRARLSAVRLRLPESRTSRFRRVVFALHRRLATWHLPYTHRYRLQL